VPAVTVLLPTHNRARYLAEAIDSVLAQTFTDIELLVLDDGSTDGTADLVATVTDPRVQYFARPRGGISASLNAGLAQARGRYIARVDSDDRWMPDLLATLVPMLDADAQGGVAYGRGQAMDQDGRLLGATMGLPLRFPGESLRSLVFDDCTCNVALVARRSCIEEAGGYDEGLASSEDWDLWLRVARRHRFLFADRVLAHVRWHDGNLTGPASPYFEATLAGRTAPLDKLFRDPDLPADVRAMRPQAYANVHLFRGLRWLLVRRRGRALGEFSASLRASDRRAEMAARIVWRACVVPRLLGSAMGRRLAGVPARLRGRRDATV
jgi:glycosyltransferase involved in cell wall biosynthesis